MLNKQIIQYSKQQAPHEMCGFVVLKEGKKRFLPCENIADDPENYFEISPDDWLKAQLQGEIVALVHSHPDGELVLSTADRQMQVNSGLDWWLVCGDEVKQFRNIPHLLGREFKHGEMDCYTLVRDAYMLSGVELDDFKRNDDWWWHNENLYLENIQQQGFEQVDNLQLGDVILIQISADVPNHAAIYLGNQQILHHGPKRLSKRDLYDGYWFKHTHSIWRFTQWQKLNFTGLLNDLAVSSFSM